MSWIYSTLRKLTERNNAMENERKDIDDIFDSIDELAGKGRFDLIDEQLKTADGTPTAASIGILYMTSDIKDKLHERDPFRVRLEEKLVSSLGYEVAREILSGA